MAESKTTTPTHPTEAQKLAVKPWIIAILASWGLALLSFAAALAYAFGINQADPRLLMGWTLGTMLVRRLIEQLCFWRVERIVEMREYRLNVWSSVAFDLLLVCVLLYLFMTL